MVATAEGGGQTTLDEEGRERKRRVNNLKSDIRARLSQSSLHHHHSHSVAGRLFMRYEFSLSSTVTGVVGVYSHADDSLCAFAENIHYSFDVSSLLLREEVHTVSF